MLGESTGQTLCDLRVSVFPHLKSAEFQHSGLRKASSSNGVTQRRSEFDADFSNSPRPLRSRRFYAFSPGAVPGNAEIAEDAEAPQGERIFGG